MGSLGDNEKKIEPMKNNWNFDLSGTDTQPVDSQFSPPSLLGGGFDGEDNDGLQYLQNTLPVDDVIPFGDAFVTQMVDPGVQTEVDLSGETQVVNTGAETQVLDECDTEVPIDSDGEQSGETQVLCDTQVLSDDDSVKRRNSCPVDKETTPKIGLNKQGNGGPKDQSDAFSNGSVPRGFTSIRAASMRATGLAARNMAFKRANNNSCSTKSGNSLEQQRAEKDGIFVSRDSLKLGNECNQKNGLEEHEKINGSRNGNTRKVGSSTVRKLFMDDMVSDIRQLDEGMNNNDDRGELPQFASENELRGLSYVNSQEPGELSQSNALDVVENFLKHNVIQSDQDVVFKESPLGKSKPVSSTKVTQILAKKATTKLTDGGCGTFNWNDNLEDEGGGEFFQKKKELFFDKVGKRQQSVKHSKKQWCLNSKTSMAVEDNRDEVEQPDSSRKSKDAVLSDSRLLSKDLRLNGQSFELTVASFKQNLINDLDEEINATSGDKRVDDGTNKDVLEMLDVGFDTQMAADAMETLCFAVGRSGNDCDNGNEGTKRVRKSSQIDDADKRSNLKQRFCRKEARSPYAAVVTRQSKKARRIDDEPHRESSLSANKQSKNVRKQLDTELVKREPKRAKLHHKDFVTNGSNILKVRGQRKKDSVQVERDFDKFDSTHVTPTGKKKLKKCPMQEQHDYNSLTPVAHRTRGQMSHAKGGKGSNSSKEGTDVIEHGARRKQWTKVGTFKTSGDEVECSKFNFDQAGKPINVNVTQLDQSHKKFLDFPKGRRTRSKLPLAGQEATTECNRSSKRLKTDVTSTPRVREERKECLSFFSGKRIPTSVDRNTSVIQEDVVLVKASKHFNVKRDAKNTSSVEVKRVNGSLEGSPKDRCKPSASASTTPVSCATPINAASPICMGDEYHKQSRRKNLVRSSLMKEINSLTATSPGPTCAVKDLRKRRDMANVRVIFSHHLDADIIKQLKKVLKRLGASIASSMSDASHFIADEFVRTRNMLEAIAFGKPVVTHLWLESCGQASCFIDERNYILRDARKEKEFGFSMPVSLALASQHALLQGQKVLITPNTKPGKEILTSLVKAVHGLALERLGRSTLKDEKFPDDLLVLSCEEDYEVCVPFLEKGAAVYSSELLLNGIVTQRLDYERHRLFTDNFKRTRSTIWLKRNNQYLPVTK